MSAGMSSGEKRLMWARKKNVRPSIYPGDILKKRKVKGEPRDNRLFVMLGVAHNQFLLDDGSHDGYDRIIIKEYKSGPPNIWTVLRKNFWFTGKGL